MTIVSMFLPSMSGTTGNTLWLYKSSDFSLVNTGGDAMTESGTSGWFTADVAEAWTETLAATVKDTNSLPSGYGYLAVGATQITDGAAVLDSATQAQIDAIETAIEEIQTSFTEATVTVTGYASIDTDGVLQLKRAETATLTFTSDSSDLVPDLSAGTTKIVMGIKDTAGRVWLSLTGTVLVATGLQSVRFVLTPTLSLALIKGHHNFDVLAIYGYDAGSTPPYASLKTFTSGRVTVTDVYLDPLGL